MILTDSEITKIFCIADDLCKEFEKEMEEKALGGMQGTPKRRRKRMMSDTEIIQS